MDISLLHPNDKFMPMLLTLSKAYHDYEALDFDPLHVKSAFYFLQQHPAYGDVYLIVLDAQSPQPEVIGYVVLSYSFSIEHGGRVATIDQFYLSPDWRRQKVGSQVLPLLEARAKENQSRCMTLEVNIGNAGARQFYQQFDYMPRRQHCIMLKQLG